MRISKVRVRNYRSIKSEIVVDFNDYLTILGPNNSGKTNFLRAVWLFFEAGRGGVYSLADDLPFGLTGGQTNIAITFFAGAADGDLLEKYQKITDLLEGERDVGSPYLTLYLSFSATGRPIYRFFTNDKVKEGKRDDYRNLQDQLVREFLDRFSVKYVPSEKSAARLFDEFLLPHIREYIADLLRDQAEKVGQALSIVSDQISSNLSNAGLGGITCQLELPEKSFVKALSRFDFFINDGERTSYSQKGSGIQAATALGCFGWISRREAQKGKNVVWLIEEPESYLHPALMDSCRKIIRELSDVSGVFITTHAIGFVPADHDRIMQTAYGKEGGTVFSKFKGYAEATESLRSSLGVRFSDYYNLTEYNVFVEGKTDKLIIDHLLSLIRPKGNVNQFSALRRASIMDFTGTSSLKDFLKATYAFMSRERSIVVVFDGDDAGTKATKELTGYFGQKRVSFLSNREYIILPNRAPIESLFPESWLEEMSQEHPSWLKIERDAFDKIVDLNMRGDKKVQIAEWLIAKSNVVTAANGGTYSWAAQFIAVFKKIDEMLISNHERVSSKGVNVIADVIETNSSLAES